MGSQPGACPCGWKGLATALATRQRGYSCCNLAVYSMCARVIGKVGKCRGKSRTCNIFRCFHNNIIIYWIVANLGHVKLISWFSSLPASTCHINFFNSHEIPGFWGFFHRNSEMFVFLVTSFFFLREFSLGFLRCMNSLVHSELSTAVYVVEQV